MPPSLGSTVQLGDYDKVAIEVLDDEPFGTRPPSTLVLNSCGSIVLRVNRDQIVSGHIHVRIVAQNPMHQQVPEYQELGTPDSSLVFSITSSK